MPAPLALAGGIARVDHNSPMTGRALANMALHFFPSLTRSRVDSSALLRASSLNRSPRNSTFLRSSGHFRTVGLHGEVGNRSAGVVSPLLANLFLHYAFDMWMARTFPSIHFERFADDVIVHCRSEAEARTVLEAIRGRLAECGLELHSQKTKTVYCKDDDRQGKHDQIKFDFLGYTFQPRRARNRWGGYFVSFLPAISTKSAQAIRKTIREWRMASTRNNQQLEDLARLMNPVVRGWMNYYGRFYRSKCAQV